MKSLKQSSGLVSFAGRVSVAASQTTNVIFETDFDCDSGGGNFNNDYGYCVAGSLSGGLPAYEPSDVTGCPSVQN